MRKGIIYIAIGLFLACQGAYAGYAIQLESPRSSVDEDKLLEAAFGEKQSDPRKEAAQNIRGENKPAKFPRVFFNPVANADSVIRPHQQRRMKRDRR